MRQLISELFGLRWKFQNLNSFPKSEFKNLLTIIARQNKTKTINL